MKIIFLSPFFLDLYVINLLRKYLFGICVSVYLFSTIGMPVYLHYCGGKLEQVSYLVKANSCCGDDEDATSDCCHNENFYLHNGSNFSIKIVHLDCSKSFSQVISQIFPVQANNLLSEQSFSCFIQKQFPPPKLCQKTILNCAVLRI